jgi:hypothetical protein
LINNRQNGRRRGRGGVRPQNGVGNGQDRGNRIDNRARGNAAQLHEKYKTLARDAQTQSDRVMTEYYLQFADHYFRILNENRVRSEEQRRTHDYQEGEDFGDEGDAAPEENFNRRDQYGRDRDNDRDNGERQPQRDRDGGERQPQQRDRESGERPERQERDGQDRYERDQDQRRDPRRERSNAGGRNDRGGLNGYTSEAVEARTPRVAPEPVVQTAPDQAAPDAQEQSARRTRRPRAAKSEQPELAIEADRLPPSFAPEPAVPVVETAAHAPKRRGRPPKRKESETVTADV